MFDSVNSFYLKKKKRKNEKKRKRKKTNIKIVQACICKHVNLVLNILIFAK